MLNYQSLKKLEDRTFLSETKGESMFDRFPLLFSSNNEENLLVKEDEEKNILSIVGCYSTTVKIQDSVVNCASIGGVATSDKARGQGLAGELVEVAFERMEEENISLAIISGRLPLYTKRGAYIVGKEYHYTLTHGIASNLVKEIKTCNLEQGAKIVYSLQKNEENRYIRSFEFIKTMLEAYKKPHHGNVAKLYYLNDSYVLIYYSPHKDEMRVIEYAGDRKSVNSILNHIAQRGNLFINLPFYETELMTYLNYKYKGEETEIPGTIKVISYKNLFQSLKYRFKRFGIEIEKIIESEDLTTVKTKRNNYIFSNFDLITMIFNGTDDASLEEFKDVFPLEFPRVNGMDFI